MDLAPGGELRFVSTRPEELEEASKNGRPAFRQLKLKLGESKVAVHHAAHDARR